MSTVHVVEEDGAFTAYDEDTGTEVQGKTKSLALVALAGALHTVDSENGTSTVSREDTGPTVEEFKNLCDSVQRQFEQHDVSEEDVEDAIEWARQQ